LVKTIGIARSRHRQLWVLRFFCNFLEIITFVGNRLKPAIKCIDLYILELNDLLIPPLQTEKNKNCD